MLFPAREPGRLRVTGHGDPFHLEQMVVQPTPALRQGLLMGINLADVFDPFGVAHQILVDLQFHFAAYFQIRIDQHVQGMVDHAFNGILNGNDPEMTGAGLNVAKHLIDA